MPNELKGDAQLVVWVCSDGRIRHQAGGGYVQTQSSVRFWPIADTWSIAANQLAYHGE